MSEPTASDRRTSRVSATASTPRARGGRFNGSSRRRSSEPLLVALAGARRSIGAGICSLQRLPVDAYPDVSPPRCRAHHAVAGPRRRRGRAADHRSDRDGDERPAEPRGDALGLALRVVERSRHVHRRHRHLLRAPAGVRAHWPARAARRRDARMSRRRSRRRVSCTATCSRAPTARRWSCTSCRTGCSTRRSSGARRRRRRVARRRDDAVSGARRSDEARRRGPVDRATSSTALSANNSNAGGGFYLRGRAVLLRARARPRRDARGHRQHRPRRARTACRCWSRTSATVEIGHAPRLGQFGFKNRTTPSKASS